MRSGDHPKQYQPKALELGEALAYAGWLLVAGSKMLLPPHSSSPVCTTILPPLLTTIALPKQHTVSSNRFNTQCATLTINGIIPVKLPILALPGYSPPSFMAEDGPEK